MFKWIVYIILSSSFSLLFSQTPKPDKLKQISAADSVFFTVKTSGCFDAGTLLYTLVKLKNNERFVLLKKDSILQKKKLTAKNYDVFVYRFRQSAQRFKYADENDKKCTLTTSFMISDKKQSLDFTNTSCEAEFNPEELLKQLMK
jgi:hypothetical protein